MTEIYQDNAVRRMLCWAKENLGIAIGLGVVSLFVLWWFLTFLVGIVFPSGPAMARVGGVAKADFSDLSEHAIFFIPVAGGQKSWSNLKEDGRFQVSYRGDDDRILPGEYRILVIDKRQEEIPEDEDLTGVRVRPSLVDVKPGTNELELEVLKLPDPLRFRFKCAYEPRQLLEGLKKKVAVVSWGLEDGRQPLVWGRFPVNGGHASRNGVCVRQVGPGSYELEDWATVLRNRGDWPEPFDSRKLLSIIGAKEIIEQR